VAIWLRKGVFVVYETVMGKLGYSCTRMIMPVLWYCNGLKETNHCHPSCFNGPFFDEY